MVRIFSVLALLSVVLLVANLAVGWTTGDMQQMTRQVLEAAQRKQRVDQSVLADRGTRRAAGETLQKALDTYMPYRRHLTRHIWLGVAASLITLLVNSVAITYSIGTARWCREVVETYDLDRRLAIDSLHHKRVIFFSAFASMLIVVAIVTLGALSDPTLTPERSSRFVGIHFLSALAGTAAIVGSYAIQGRQIAANSRIIGTIMEQVEAHTGVEAA
ncbi:MAG TPA: hypothetical protein ENJ62_07865 [Bryobacterales bacterium]|nr:hypothetical protein [Bryobacterales bacterium]